MDDPTDDSWTPNGAQLTYQRVSYHNGGYLVTGRTSTWRGIKQDFKHDKVETMMGSLVQQVLKTKIDLAKLHIGPTKPLCMSDLAREH